MRYQSVAISAAITLCANHAFAQAEKPFLLGAIFIGSDATNEIGIDNEDLTRTAPTDLQDVFKTEPSVSVGNSLPISQKIYVNGVEENNLNVSIDGARQNNRIFQHSATTYIDPELLKAVRVDPGVAPADAGPGALAGAIAFETKDVDDLLDPDLSFGGRFTTEYQTGGDTVSSSLALYGREGTFEYLVFGKFADGGTREDGSDNEIVRSSINTSVGAEPRADLPSAAITRMKCPPPSPSYSISRRGLRRVVHCACTSSGMDRRKPVTKSKAIRPWSRVRAAMIVSRRGCLSHSPSNEPSAIPADSAVFALPRPMLRTATFTPSAKAPLTNCF